MPWLSPQNNNDKQHRTQPSSQIKVSKRVETDGKLEVCSNCCRNSEGRRKGVEVQGNREGVASGRANAGATRHTNASTLG